MRSSELYVGIAQMSVDTIDYNRKEPVYVQRTKKLIMKNYATEIPCH